MMTMMIVAQAVQNNPDLLFRRMALAACPADSFTIRSGGDSGCTDFCLVLWGIGFRAIRGKAPTGKYRMALGVPCNLLDELHDAAPYLSVFDLHERFGQREPI